MVENREHLPIRILQKAVVIDEENNALSIKRVDDFPGPRPGKWDLPGGSLEDIDRQQVKPHRAAIIRELNEETGLQEQDVILIEAIFVDSVVQEKALVLAVGYRIKAKGVKPEIKLSHEHAEYVWTTKTELLTLDFGEDGGFHKAIIERI